MDNETKTITVIDVEGAASIYTAATYVTYGELWITINNADGSRANHKASMVKQVLEQPNVG